MEKLKILNKGQTQMNMKIKVKKILENATLPKRATDGSAGLDLCVCLSHDSLEIKVGDTFTTRTGIAVEIPHGYVGMIVPRSSVGKTGLRLANTVGVIDSDYRGEILLVWQNTEDYPIIIKNGQRVAQILIVPVCMADVVQVDELSKTERGSGSFGSTGE